MTAYSIAADSLRLVDRITDPAILRGQIRRSTEQQEAQA